MKKFLRKRWHSIPVGLVSVLLALALVGGSAFAAFTAWTGTVDVTVGEAIGVVYQDTAIPPGSGASVGWNGGTHTLSVSGLMPGEAVGAGFLVSSDSSVALPVTVTMVRTGGATAFQDGTDADVANVAPGKVGPAPAYSWMTPVLFWSLVDPGIVGNPLTFDVPAGESKYVIFALQAGTSIVPGAYSFQLTVDR